jgi:hypothetical protein
VDTRAAKAEEERRMLELQAIRRAAEERDYRAATLLQVRDVAPFFLFLLSFLSFERQLSCRSALYRMCSAIE